jgi:capsular exopolysaccharide synthesis family protein
MDDKINLKVLLRKLIARWYYFLIMLLVVLPLTYLFLHWVPEQYAVKATLLLQPESTSSVKSEKFLKGMDLLSSTTELEDEIGILSSYSVVEAAVRQLDFGVSYFVKDNMKTSEIYDDPPFFIKIDSSVNQIVNVPVYIDRVSQKKFNVYVSGKKVDVYNFYTNEIEEKLDEVSIQGEMELDSVSEETTFTDPHLSFKIRFNGPYHSNDTRKKYFVVHDLKGLAESYQKKLKVTPISRESNIVSLDLKGTVPRKDVLFLDKLLDVYLKNELYKKNQFGMRTIQFIDQQLSGVSDSLKEVEGSLELFRVKNNIIDIGTTSANVTKNLDDLEKDKSEQEVKLKYYKYILNTMKNQSQMNDIVAPSTFGLEDPLLSNLLIELSKLNQERSALNYSAKEGSPLAAVIDLKTKNTRKTIIENVTNLVDATAFSLSNIENRIQQLQTTLRRLPRNERELVNIKRRFDFSDNVYNYLLEKRAEAGIAIASNTVEKTIIDKAKQVGRGPVFPNSRMIYIVAFVVAMMGGLGLIIGKDFLNDNIINQQDVERFTTIPFIGTISHANRRERTNVVADARTQIGESFRALRVNLQYLTLGKHNNVIGFTSSSENEGKTYCSVNLAASMALSKRRTVLIDADLRRPKVVSYFQLEGKKGLSNYLIDKSSARDIIYSTPIKGFDVIPSGPVPPNPLDLIGQPRMDELIEELKQSYSTIVIDSPPIGYVSEYIILMKYTDANIYVVRSNKTNRFELDKINKLYETRKIRNVNILLNDVKGNTLNGYGYKYSQVPSY